MKDIGNFRLHAPDGHYFGIKRVASLTVTGQPEINREDLKRMIAVTGRISGRDLGSSSGTSNLALPVRGYAARRLYPRGIYEQQQTAFAGLMAVFGAAVLLVFFLLLFLYESFPTALAYRRFASLRRRSLHRPRDHRDRAEHLFDDGPYDDHRHRDRNGHLLRLGVRRPEDRRKGRQGELILAGVNRMRPSR